MSEAGLRSLASRMAASEAYTSEFATVMAGGKHVFTRGTLFRITVEVDERRLSQMRRAPELAQAALQAAADFWHTGILPEHFTGKAHARYGYAARSISYMKSSKKRGKPDLVFSGSLARDLRARASFSQKSTSVELRMTARVLNLVPRMAENSTDIYVQQKGGRGYPNLKREVKAIIDSEREQLAEVVAAELEKAFGPLEGAGKETS